ncbi:hypothetical protein IWZ01DRAFT_497512 [Phyllosticta capitalensis]
MTTVRDSAVLLLLLLLHPTSVTIQLALLSLETRPQTHQSVGQTVHSQGPSPTVPNPPLHPSNPPSRAEQGRAGQGKTGQGNEFSLPPRARSCRPVSFIPGLGSGTGPGPDREGASRRDGTA